MSVDMKQLEEQFEAEKEARFGDVAPSDGLSAFYKEYNGKKINVLGTEWTIKVLDPDDNRLTEMDCTGLCEAYTKEIYVKDRTSIHDFRQYLNIEDFLKKVIRHEIIHATFFETGNAKYYEDEDLTEILAHLVPKMAKVMTELNLM